MSKMTTDGRLKTKKQSVSLRFQKNVMGKMGTGSAKALLDDKVTIQLLDDLSDLVELDKSEKYADKYMKNIIKIVVKVGILFKNKQFTPEELTMFHEFRTAFKRAIMTIVSFYDVPYSFDIEMLQELSFELNDKLKKLLSRHLTDKSLGRAEAVFEYMRDEASWKTSFEPGSKTYLALGDVVKDLTLLLEQGKL
eukprot:CFRG3764T1